MNRAVFANLPVHTFETTLDEARALGAMALFGEKYGDVVRVVEISGTSTELCGGTHVRTTAEIGSFVILSEGSVGGGARRIEAVTSGEAWAALHARAAEAEALRAELEETRRELKRKPQAGAIATADPDAQVSAVNGVNLVVQAVEGFDDDALLELSDRFKQRHAPAAVVLGSAARGQGVARRELRRGRRGAHQRVRRDPRRRASRRRRRRRPADDGPSGREGRGEAAGGAGGGRATDPRGSVRVLALDYGAARTGVAVSDPTGTLARPVCVVERAGSVAGLDRVAALVAEHEAGLVVVGMPLTLRGERGEQARETEEFVQVLRTRLEVPVETEDERFTTTLAQQSGGQAPEDALAAAHLLQGWLERTR